MRFNIVKAKTALLVAGKNQCEIAESLELSRRWVGAAFNGRNISEKTARHIAAALGVPLDELKEVLKKSREESKKGLGMTTEELRKRYPLCE